VIQKITLLLCLSFFAFSKAKADIFWVTTTSDRDAGSLRAALEGAAANDTLTYDTIYFNIPITSGSVQQQRAIVLGSELPLITSKIIIDATSQPGPPLLAGSDAKIYLLPINYGNAQKAFTIQNAANIEIYGFYIYGFAPTPTLQNVQNEIQAFGDGIYMHNVSNIKIGDFGKGNTITQCYYAVRHDVHRGRFGDADSAKNGANIVIRGNFFGKVLANIARSDGDFFGVKLINVNNITVAANEFRVLKTAIWIKPQVGFDRRGNRMYVAGNQLMPIKYPLQFDEPEFRRFFPERGIWTERYGNDLFTFDSLWIQENSIAGYNNALGINGLENFNGIFNNTIDTFSAIERDGLFAAGISINFCEQTFIGGEADSANYIRGYTNNIFAFFNQSTRISRNAVICSRSPGITNVSPQFVPTISLPRMHADTIFGKTCANCKVEVFRNNTCLSQPANGNIYDTTLIANANGDFTYLRPNHFTNCNFTFTSTSLQNNTSRYFLPKDFLVNITGARTFSDTCSRGKGSIRGVKFSPYTSWYWQNDQGQSFGINDTNLVNVPGGFYWLVVTHNFMGCEFRSPRFLVGDRWLDVDTSDVILQDAVTCTPNSGSIRFVLVRGLGDSVTIRWFQNGNLYRRFDTIVDGVTRVVSTGLNNIPVGTYKVRVNLKIDTTCFFEFDDFIIGSRVGATLDSSRVRIIDDSCGNGTGSIRFLRVVNPALNFARNYWEDSAGQVVAYNIQATGLRPGLYRYVYEDSFSCGILYSSWYRIYGLPGVRLNEDNVQTSPTGCTTARGFIRGIVPNFSGLYSWYNVTTNTVVGNQLNISNLPAGSYQLVVRVGNCTASSQIYDIGTTNFIPISVDSIVGRDAKCNLSNGSVTAFISNPNARNYSFRWLGSNQTVLGQQLQLNNINGGTYNLQAIDSNGCSQNIGNGSIVQRGKPSIDRQISLQQDTCAQNLGAINALGVNGGTAPYTYRWLKDGQTTTNTSNAFPNAGAGNYRCVVTDALGCQDSSALINIRPINIFIPPPQFEPDGRNLIVLRNDLVNFILKNPQYRSEYGWYNGNVLVSRLPNGNFSIRPARDTSFAVQTIRGICSSAKTIIRITAIPDADVTMTNAFSPNGDGVNDDIGLKVDGVFVLKNFEVFNRYGQTVFQTNRDNVRWTGRSNGQDLAVGTYYYIVTGSNYFGKPVLLKGSITLLR
jgi:gliding motility-associated-like protein